MKIRYVLLFALGTLLLSIPAFAQQRVVAIGDVHGAYEDFIVVLQKAALIDEQKQWIGGKATFIQIGDILDRGAGGRAAMDLLMALEQQAPEKGGRVSVLLGNHEMMNLVGDLRYVTAEDYANYTDGESQKRRESAYQLFIEFQKNRTKALHQPETAKKEGAKDQWIEAHPPGFLEHRDAFAPEGKYGKWLRKREAIEDLDGTIFLHGGISPVISKLTVKQINQRVKEEIALFDSYKSKLVNEKIILPFFTFEEMTAAVNQELQFREKTGNRDVKLLQDFLAMNGWLTINKDGPLWFRGYAEWSDAEGASQIEDLLKTYGAKHMVVGHTVRKDGKIQTRFNNKVFVIDTGMLRSYVPTGQASALEIADGKFTAIYKDKRVLMTSDSR